MDGSDLGPLLGIPLAYKDEFYTNGVLTTCGSRILSEFVPDYDATAVAKLHQAGAIMLGKENRMSDIPVRNFLPPLDGTHDFKSD